LDFSLRELWWRKEAREREAWAHTSWLCSFIPNFSKEARPCNPLLADELQRQSVTPEEFRLRRDELKGVLPDKLTQAEKDRRWAEFCAAVASQM
jgi:hypothetical protein